MKTLKEFLGEARRISGSSSLLPTGSNIHPDRPEKNWLHKDWSTDGYKMTYLLLHKVGSTEKHVLLAGSGSPENYPDVGSNIRGQHDQTFRDLGHWTVKHKVSSDKVNEIPVKKSMPLWVYK